MKIDCLSIIHRLILIRFCTRILQRLWGITRITWSQVRDRRTFPMGLPMEHNTWLSNLQGKSHLIDQSVATKLMDSIQILLYIKFDSLKEMDFMYCYDFCRLCIG